MNEPYNFYDSHEALKQRIDAAIARIRAGVRKYCRDSLDFSFQPSKVDAPDLSQNGSTKICSKLNGSQEKTKSFEDPLSTLVMSTSDCSQSHVTLIKGKKSAITTSLNSKQAKKARGKTRSNLSPRPPLTRFKRLCHLVEDRAFSPPHLLLNEACSPCAAKSLAQKLAEWQNISKPVIKEINSTEDESHSCNALLAETCSHELEYVKKNIDHAVDTVIDRLMDSYRFSPEYGIRYFFKRKRSSEIVPELVWLYIRIYEAIKYALEHDLHFEAVEKRVNENDEMPPNFHVFWAKCLKINFQGDAKKLEARLGIVRPSV